MFVRANSPNKSKLRLNRFNGYVLCFLFMILCILLILAYRIEVKVIQQNYKTHYESYIKEVKDHLIKEENFIILNRSKFDSADEYYRYKHSFDDGELEDEDVTEYNSYNTTEVSMPPEDAEDSEEDLRFDNSNSSEEITDDIPMQNINMTEKITNNFTDTSTKMTTTSPISEVPTTSRPTTNEEFLSNVISSTTEDMVTVTSTQKQTSKFYSALKPKFEQLSTLDTSTTIKDQGAFSLQSKETDVSVATTEEGLTGESTDSSDTYDPFKPMVLRTEKSETTQKDYDPLKAKPIGTYITETVSRINNKNHEDELKTEIPFELKVDMTVEPSTDSNLKMSTEESVSEETDPEVMDFDQGHEDEFNDEGIQIPLFPTNTAEEMMKQMIDLNSKILSGTLDLAENVNPFNNDDIDLDNSTPLLTGGNRNNVVIVARVN